LPAEAGMGTRAAGVLGKGEKMCPMGGVDKPRGGVAKGDSTSPK